MSYIKKGTEEFKNTCIALFIGGFNTFAFLYCTQPILPSLSKEFNISPTIASLSVSFATISLAISLLLMGSLSEVFGRKQIMAFSLITASILMIITSLVPNYATLLIFRVIQGFVLAGLNAIAMAYISEEIEEKSLGAAMGLFISGNSIGGMGGRVVIATLTDFFGWRYAFVSIGVIGIIFSIIFWVKLPSSRHFKPRKLEIRELIESIISHLKNRNLVILYCIGFLLMGSNISLYNYIGYQLIAPPYCLNQTIVSFIFLMYIVGTFSSPWMGGLAYKYGQRRILKVAILLMLCGDLLTLGMNLILKILGIAIMTFGFFGGHSIVSSWVGGLASHDKAQATSLYLFFYYVGSSIGGTTSGIFESYFGWGGIVSIILCFLLLAIFLTFYLPLGINTPSIK